ARSVSDPIMSPGFNSPRKRAARTCATMRLDADIGRASFQRDQLSVEGFAPARKFPPRCVDYLNAVFRAAKARALDSCIIVLQFQRNHDPRSSRKNFIRAG